VRNEFGKGNDFCQKITYRSVKDSDELIAEFRNSPELRIAVTVDQIATGTDIKPLECLLFMRDVRSRGYFEQMLGRGVRVINNADFRAVTPDATAKELFMVVDAVGVTEHDRFEEQTQPLDRKPTVALKALLDLAGKGSTDPDLASTLASRLARLDRRLTRADRERLTQAAGGVDLTTITQGLEEASDPDHQRERAVAVTGKAEPTPAEITAQANELVGEALKPLAANPDLRTMIFDLRKSYEQTIDETSIDVVEFAGYSKAGRERASAMVTSFKDFIEKHRDDIHALQVLYSVPYAERLTYRDVKELADTLARPPHNWTPDRLWAAYDQLDRDKVRGSGQRILTDVISLVRFALELDDELVPFHDHVDARFAGWLAMQEQAGPKFTEEQRRWLGWMKDHIATSMGIDTEALDLPPFVEQGGIGKAAQLFGDRLTPLMEQLSKELAA